MLKKVSKLLFQKSNISILLLIILGSLVWSSTMIRSGKIYNFGMGFWGPNAHDGLWHIAISKSLASFSFENPVYAGNLIKNYHVGFDFLLGIISRISQIDVFFIYFTIFPIVCSFGVGILSYIYSVKLFKSKFAAFWSVFFVYFGGGLGSIVHLVRYGKLGGDSMFWAQSSATTLINPPFALSLVFLLLILMIIAKSEFYKSTRSLIFLGFFLFAAFQIKVYAGLLLFLSFFILSIYLLFIRKTYYPLLVFLISSAITLLLFLPLNRNSYGLVDLAPFWFLEGMVLFEDRLFFERYYMAMTTYKSTDLFKFILSYLVAFLIFLFGNIGVRILAYFSIKKIDTTIFIFATTTILVGTFIPMIFVQKGTPWNTIQFFYYPLFLLGLFSGGGLDYIREHNKKLLKWILAIAILFTIPTNLATLSHYLVKNPHTYISNDELEALRFLSQEKNDRVLTLTESNRGNGYPIKPIYLYETTSYVSALSGKKTFLDDVVNLTITNYDFREREQKIDDFKKNTNSKSSKDFLVENNIDYIYAVKDSLIGLDEATLSIKNIFDNEEVRIYEVIN